VEAPSAPRHILVVDDDEGLLVLMSEVLQAEGFQVTTLDSGARAFDWLVEHTPDLMLLDLKMKEVGGTTLLKRLRREDAPVPFVVVTGQGDEKIAVDLMKQGALDYVMKDSGLLDLLPGVVKRALETTDRDRALAAAQSRLRDSETRFASAVAATLDGVWEVRFPGSDSYFSARFAAILGLKPEDLAQTFASWPARLHPEDRVRFLDSYQAFLDGGGSSFSNEHRLRHQDGTYRWVLARALLVRDAEGKPLRLTGALTDLTERKQLEKEVLRISDREQWRIGQDLHDGLGQQLTAIEFMCQSLRSDLASARPDLANQVSRMCQFLRDAISQTRSLAHGLTPFMLDATGLQAALSELAHRTHSLGRVACRFECPSPVLLKDSEVAGHLYRIAQEAVGNALKHAGASEIVISLEARDEVIRLEIADDGRGLSRGRKSVQGIGLQVMRHRANAIGADLTLDTKRGQGSGVICTLRRPASATSAS
jgi:PAS domain S-box-containing protein